MDLTREAKELAEEVRKLQALEVEAKDSAKDYRDRVDLQRRRVSDLASDIREGSHKQLSLEDAVDRFAESVPAGSSVSVVSAAGEETVLVDKRKDKAAH